MNEKFTSVVWVAALGAMLVWWAMKEYGKDEGFTLAFDNTLQKVEAIYDYWYWDPFEIFKKHDLLNYNDRYTLIHKEYEKGNYIFDGGLNPYSDDPSAFSKPSAYQYIWSHQQNLKFAYFLENKE